VKVTFKGLTPFIFFKKISELIDPILRSECIQNGRLGFSKIANCTKLLKKGGGPRVKRNCITEHLVSSWVSAPNTPPEI
jgi:hypothetical protein